MPDFDVKERLNPLIGVLIRGRESLIPISMDKDKHIALITRNNFNSFTKELKSGKLLEIR